MWRDCERGSRQGAGRERKKTGHGTHAFIRVRVECFEIPGLKQDWSVQTKKSSVLLSFMEGLGLPKRKTLG